MVGRPNPRTAAHRSIPPEAAEAVSGDGAALPAGLRLTMEHRFGEDFSGVRVHDGPAAHRGTVGLFAQGLTVGEHVALAPGVAAHGSGVLAHELAHVVQQRQASVRTSAVGSAPALEAAADGGGHSRAAAAGPARAVPAVQFASLRFGAGSVSVAVDGATVTVNGVKVGASADPDGRIRFNGREVVLDRSGVMRYRDRYTVCRPCNPDYYEGARWSARAGTTLPEAMGSFYDPVTRSWVLRNEPVVTTAVLTPSGTATPGPVDPRLEERVRTAQAAREQFESRVDAAMANGRARQDAEALVRQRMQAGADPRGLGTFETGQTYAVVTEEAGPGVVRQATTGAVAGGETPTVTVPAPELRARLAQINHALGENFVVNDQTLNHAEVRAVVRTPNALTYYVNRDMCPSCQRYFLLEAQAQNRTITVVDPSTTRVFSPGYRITEYHPTVVYERTGALTRADGVTRLEIGEHPAVTHSVRSVPRTTPVPPAEVVAGRSPAGPGEEHAPGTLGKPRVRPGVVEPEIPGRAGGLGRRGGRGIRRFVARAGRILAEGLLTIAMVIVDLIITLIIVPYLERLQRQLEEKYRKLMEQEIQDYYESRLAGRVENRMLRQAGWLKTYEDRDEQPYVNTTLRVHFKRAWSIWTGQGHGPPESIVDLDFVSMEILDVDVSNSPVEEGSDPLKADDEHMIVGDRFSTEFSQVVRFPAIPPSYQELVEQFGPDPASRAKAECFIATACYGDVHAPALDTLRFFRDQHLAIRAAGRRFIDAYYRLSPAVADLLRRNRSARWVVRTLLVAPLVQAVRLLRMDQGSRGQLDVPRFAVAASVTASSRSSPSPA